MEVVLKAQFKNGLLYKAVQKCGSAKALADYLGVGQGVVGRWLNFQDTPDFRGVRASRYKAKYDAWDMRLVGLIGVGLEEIFPPGLRLNKAVIRENAKIEAFLDLPVERLIEAGAAPKLLPSPYEFVDQMDAKRVIDMELQTLTPREEKVLKLRFGLGGEREHTLQEIGQIFGLSRMRIDQIAAKALRKMRNPKRSKNLKYLLEGKDVPMTAPQKYDVAIESAERYRLAKEQEERDQQVRENAKKLWQLERRMVWDGALGQQTIH